MNRIDIYNEIKSFGAQDRIENYFGRNFTNVSTEDLNWFLDEYIRNNRECVRCESDCKEELVAPYPYESYVDRDARKAIKAIAEVIGCKYIVKNL